MLRATIFLVLLLSSALRAAEYHVSPAGTATGTGSAASPWDLQTALNHPASVRPGDTLWLREGVYRGSFRSWLTGTAEAPIVVRQYPGERAIVDVNGFTPMALYLGGAHTWYWGFEVTNSSPATRRATGLASDWRAHGITIADSGVKGINLVLYDTGNPAGMWSSAENSELYGCIVFHNGWSDDYRGHGEGVYSQNNTGTKRIVDNIFFKQFDSGLITYGSADSFLRNYHIEGNICFDNGSVHTNGGGTGILIGGGSVAENYTVVHNYLYNRFDRTRSNNMNLSYREGSRNMIVRDNYSAGKRSVDYRVPIQNLTASGNTLIGWMSDEARPQFPVDSNSISYIDFYAAPTYPAQNRVFVRRNQYEQGRAHIAVFNWQNLASVNVDLSTSGLLERDRYEVRDVQNFLGPAIASGTYTSGSRSVALPMNLTAVHQSPGLETFPNQPLNTAPQFGTFVVLKTGSVPLPQTVATPVISPNGGTFSGSVTVSLTCATNGATIRYTTDGTAPVSTSPVYAAPFTLSASARVQAQAFAAGMTNSAVASAEFALNRLPEVESEASATPTRARIDEAIGFSVTASDDDGDDLVYAWDFGDGTAGDGAAVSHAYSGPGVYTARVTISDSYGESVTSSVAVTVHADPVDPPPGSNIDLGVVRVGERIRRALPLPPGVAPARGMRWGLTADLPKPLRLLRSGQLTGKPVSAGIITFTVKLTRKERRRNADGKVEMVLHEWAQAYRLTVIE